MVYLLNMVIFYSYVKLPEGIPTNTPLYTSRQEMLSDKMILDFDGSTHTHTHRHTYTWMCIYIYMYRMRKIIQMNNICIIIIYALFTSCHSMNSRIPNSCGSCPSSDGTLVYKAQEPVRSNYHKPPVHQLYIFYDHNKYTYIRGYIIDASSIVSVDISIHLSIYLPTYRSIYLI